MAVHISINGNSAGDGFLIVPLDSTYDAEISLWTDAGNLSVTLQAMPDPANLVFSTAGPINISPVPTSVNVHSTLISGSRGDTTIQVLDGATVVASFTVTSIRYPVVNFSGRFESRFATDGAFYNANPMYTAGLDTVVPPGWTWGLEGETSFVPAAGLVPENLETPGMGRNIRLNNPVALRSHAAPVVSSVASITGETSSGNETFFAGDPLIGQPVNFGPDTYFAGNQPSPPLPQPEERFSAAQEPMALFKIDLGNPALYFRGASQVGPFTHLGVVNERTRVPDSRPIAAGLVSAAAEIAEFGLPNLTTFSDTRIDLLVADYNALPAGPSQQRRNLVRRIGHLLSSVSAAKRTAVQAANPGAFTLRQGTLPQGWPNKEVYNGKVDTDLHALPGGSSVVDYLRQFFSFDIQWNPFAFHSDELCGYHKGTLQGDVTMTGNHIGDPHTRTVNGTNYDFQSVGEFTLLRGGDTMEIQVRQSPVATQNPITDSYSGLTACVSVITAVAARVGSHQVSLQPGRENKRLQFYLDGKPANLSSAGFDLGGHRVTGFDANNETGLRIDYADGTVVIATPAFWTAHNIAYINVSISNTRAEMGIMGYIPKKSWLPRLRTGEDLGPRPASMHDRYVALYKTFADSWRISDKTSLFVYTSGTSTRTFTDPDWPVEEGPCNLKPEFQIPGVPIFKGMPVEQAEKVCKDVTIDDLHKNCVFDVAATGDEIFAKGYLLAQELRISGTSVKITASDPPSRSDRKADEPADDSSNRSKSILVRAEVLPLNPGRPVPKGTVTFYVDNKAVSDPVELNSYGVADLDIVGLEKGEYDIRAAYTPADSKVNHSSSSPNLRYSVSEDTVKFDGETRKGCLFRPWIIWAVSILVLLLLVLLVLRLL